LHAFDALAVAVAACWEYQRPSAAPPSYVPTVAPTPSGAAARGSRATPHGSSAIDDP
jgi:hypothetical protein